MSRSLIVRSGLLATALVCLLGGAAVAGDGVDLSGITGFDEFAENHEGIAKALSKRPSLAQDPSYLEHHPTLKKYLHDNPLARAEFDAEDDTLPSSPPPKGADTADWIDGHPKHYPKRFVFTNNGPDDE